MVHRVIEEDLKIVGEKLRPIIAPLAGKTILITGGAGFLGRYMVGSLLYCNQYVLEKPCTIVVADNFITGLKENFPHQQNLVLVEHDVSKPYTWSGNIDYILHAAGIASPVFYKKYRIETIDVGVFGTKHMLELAREKKVKSFMLFSSSEIYGDPDPRFVPTPETYFGNVSCTGARACYDESKRVAETLAINYHEVHGVPVKILRPFNIYGPGMRLDDYRVVPNFVVAALYGHKIPIYGEGNHTRTFCYVSDAVVGMFQVLLSSHNGEAFNIGSDNDEIMIESLAHIIADLFNNGVQVHKIIGPNDAYTKADPKRRCPDLSKIRRVVGYEPTVDIQAGLRRFIEWAKDQDLSRAFVRQQ